jgi:hypothetical protein
MGMSDEPMGLFNIWLGPDKIDQQLTASIYANAGTSTLLGLLAILQQQGEEGPSLRFDGSFYYPGGQSSDSWDHMDGVIGSVIRWPYTMWLGFEQLDLGQYPRVPQLTFEIGPDGGGIAPEDNNTTWRNQTDPNGDPYQKANGEISGKDIYGQTYYQRNGPGGGGNTLVVLDTNGVMVGEQSATQIAATIAALQADDNGGHQQSGGVCVIGNGRYVAIVHNSTSPAHASQSWEDLSLWRPVDGGFPELICSYRMLIGFSSRNGGEACVAIAGKGTDADTLVTFTSETTPIDGSVHRFRFYPTIAEYEAKTWAAGGPGTSSPRTYEVQLRTKNGNTSRLSAGLKVTGASNVEVANNHLNHKGFFFTAGGNINFYFSKDEQQWHNDNPTHASRWNYNTEVIEPSYPNGAWVRINLGTITPYTSYSATEFGESDVTVINDKFIDQDGNVVAPFDDDRLNIDGTDGNGNPYVNTGAGIRWLDDLNTLALVVVPKIFSDNASHSDPDPDNETLYIKIRAFIYNTLTDTFTQFAETGPMRVWDENSVNGGPYSGPTFWGNYWGSRLHIDPNTYQISYSGVQGPSAVAYDSESAIGNEDLGLLSVGVGGDLTPAEIIRRLLQDDIYGRGLSNTIVDQTSFSVAHQYCIDNGFLVSTQYRRESGNLGMIQQLLSVYDGFLIIVDGQIKFGVRELTLAPVRTIDNDHLIISDSRDVPIHIHKGAQQDTYNKIRVNFISRSLDYQQDQIEVGDEVDQDFNGMRLKEFPLQFVMSPQTATQMGVRALWGNLYARDTYEFKLGIKDQDLTPGDVITLVDSVSGLATNARIISWRERERFQFEVGAIQEFNYINASSISNVSVSSPTSATQQKNIGFQIDQVVYELPAEFSIDGISRLFGSYLPEGAPAGATLYVSADGTSYARAQTNQPYPLAGSIIGGLPLTKHGTFNSDVEIFMFPSSGFETDATSQFERFETLSDVSGATRAAGGSTIIVGSEVMAYEGVTLVSQNRYRLDRLYRGWGGTHIHAHTPGAHWFKHGGGIFWQEYNEDKIGTNVWFKMVPFDAQGNESNISSITATQYTVQGMHYRPQVAPEPRFISGSVDYRGQTGVFVNSTVDIPLDWKDSARQSGYGASGYGIGAYGRFTTDALSHSWRVEVVGSDDIIVRSTVVGTAHFTYTSSENFEDNGAWRGNVAFKVTPFSEHGDAPRTEVLSLNLWV